MRSPALALTWQHWRRHRLGLSVIAAGFLAVAATFQIAPAGSIDAIHGSLLSILFVLALIYLTAVFAYGFDSPLEKAGSCFPARQFTLPVRSVVLAGWPILQAMGVVALFWAAWTWLVLWPSGMDIEPGPGALLAAAMVAVTSAILWWPFGLPGVRLVVAMFVLVPLALSRSLAQSFGIHEVWVLALHFTLIPAAAGVAIVGVTRARRGEATRWRSSSRSKQRVLQRKPFPSAGIALLWLEWRRKLFWFPLMIGSWTILFLPVIFLVEPSDESRIRVGVNFLVLPLLAAAGLGPELGRVGAEGKPNVLAVFTAVRPVSTAALVAAKLKVAALGALIAWGITLLAAAVWFFGTGLHSQVPTWWRQAIDAGRGWELGIGVPLALLVLILATWRGIVVGLWAGLTGRKWVFQASLLALALVIVGGAMTLAGLVNDPGAIEQLRTALPWIAAAAVATKLALAGVLLRSLAKRQLVESRTLKKWLGVWLLAAVGLFCAALWLVPAARESPGLFACGVILFLPLARLAAAPLALHWNRHR